MLKLIRSHTIFMCKFIRVRSNYTKKLPADHSYADDYPVYEYPVRSQSETSVYAWGLSEHGALGHYLTKRKKMKNKSDPKFKIFKKPFRHLFAENHRVKDIAAGYGFSVFSVKSNTQQKLFGTGINTDSQIGYQTAHNKPLSILLSPVPINLGLKHPTKTQITSISAGRAHLAVVTDSEGVFTLGNNSYGQCGRTVIKNEQYFGSRVVYNIPCFESEPIIAVECGQDHTMFLTESGKVYSCGWGADGQTGLNTYDNQYFPKRVLGDIDGEKIVKISSKCDCVLAVNDKGDVFGWGNSEYGQIYKNTQQINVPRNLPYCRDFGKIVDVAAAGSFCMILNDEGEVFSWGYGILGRGPNVSYSTYPGIIAPTLFGKNEFRPDSKVVSIYCGLNYSSALTNHGSIYMWGKNKHGCLGLGPMNDVYFPLAVFISGNGKKLALGVDHSLALCKSV